MSFTTNSRYHDNTMISTYKECPRKYLLRHVLGWTISSDYYDDRKPAALVFGSSWHAGMDAIWGAGQNETNKNRVDAAMEEFRTQWEEDGYTFNLSPEEAEDLGARTPGTAHEMFYSYVQQREGMLSRAVVLGIEQPIAIPFPELEDTWYVGKLDKVVEYNGTHVLEHKTTTLYRIKGNFDQDYLESWNSASQVKGYQLAGSLYYPKLQDVWVDCSLVHKKIHDAFKFVPVAHSWPLLQEWIVDTRRWILAIHQETDEYKAIGSLKKGTFRRNEDQCYGKYSKCPFLNICSTCPDPTQLDGPPPGYKLDRWAPFEVLNLDKLIKDETSEPLIQN